MTSFGDIRSELDAMIVDIELTLVSIIQGVALTVLIEASHEVIAKLDGMMWQCVLSGLIIILIFWSRVVLHILTLIRWPLEFGHNLLYRLCACGSVFIRTTWQPCAAVRIRSSISRSAGCSLRMICALGMRARDRTGAVGNRLYALVTRDQRLQARAEWREQSRGTGPPLS